MLGGGTVRGGVGILFATVSILPEFTALLRTWNFTSSRFIDINTKAGGVPEWQNQKRVGGHRRRLLYCVVFVLVSF